MRRTIVSVSAAFIILSGAALAQPTSTGAPQMAVTYGDLNLDSKEGAQILINRIRSAADQVCGGRPYIGDLERWDVYRPCVAQSMDRAVLAVHRPLVSRLYEPNEPSEMASR